MFGKFDPTSAELREDINLTQIDVARILVGDTCMDGPPNDGALFITTILSCRPLTKLCEMSGAFISQIVSPVNSSSFVREVYRWERT